MSGQAIARQIHLDCTSSPGQLPALPDAHLLGTILGLMTWKPWAFFWVAVAGWMNRPQQDVMAYLAEENGILREQLGHKRIIRNVAQKHRLGVAGNEADRDLLQYHGTLSW